MCVYIYVLFYVHATNVIHTYMYVRTTHMYVALLYTDPHNLFGPDASPKEQKPGDLIAFIYTYMRACIYTYIHTHTYTHTHTHTHTRTHINT